MTVTAFLVLFTLECSAILLYLSLQVYRRKTILGQYYFWMILFLLSIISLLLGLENIGEIYPDFGPYPVSPVLNLLTNFCGHLITTIWFFFCLLYAGKSKYLTRPIIAFLLGYTVIGNIVFQMVKHYSYSSGIPLLDTFLWLFGMSALIKCCILYLAGIGLLIQKYRNVSDQFRYQILILVGTSCLVVLLVTFFDSRLFPGFNPVGIHFGICGLIFGFGMLYFDLLTFSPVFRERFFGVVESGLVVLNNRCQIIDMNETAEKILHTSLADVFGRGPGEVAAFPEGFSEMVSNPDLLKNAAPLSMLTDDETRWFRISVQHDHGNVGAEEVYLVMITDITHNILLEKQVSEANSRLLVEKEKKRQELLYREFFNSHRDAILIVADGIISDCNQVALHFFGKKRSEIVGLDPCLLSSPSQVRQSDVPDKLKYQISQAASGELIDFSWVFIANTLPVEAEVRLSRLVYDDQVLVEMCIRDVSQATSAMMQIRQDNDLLNRIVANDIYLWNQVSQLARKEHGSMGRECQHSLEEIVQKATQNLNLAPSPSDEKMNE
ncbi:MAG TPA: histidine kinase N-terminal 7TM domain-containing protein [Methanospirillum sp.]|uniref:histidine kinase N-terminal 7TM domain-containing protein n=1 Tax=Methanospirillum sp. TaxID=45200 RepID=UPI002B5F1290|nr:histidine kinase N-terminal 7TM domain-containing protein [Methanospirillum sp.]HWQ64569.1 histidine kinase N-terminal 7TM domain-containing protein [Methanospirillum sp.]